LVLDKKYSMKKYTLIIFGIIIFNFLIRIPFLDFPAHWDEIVYFWGTWKVFDNHLNPFVEFWSYKPPLLFELTAIFYKIFGVSRWAGRLIIALSSSLSIFLTYKLGEKVFTPKVGLWASILLFLNPLFFTQSNLFHTSILMTALFLAAIYFYLKKRFWLYFLFGSLLVLTKEPGVLIITSIFCFDFFINFKKNSLKKVVKKSLLILSPLSVFVIWLLLNKHFMGWYLWPYNASYFTFFSRPYERCFFNTFSLISFREQFLWFIFSFISFALLFSTGINVLRKKIFNKWFFYLFSLSLIFPFIFYFGAFLPRYLLFTLPGLFLSFAWILEKVLNREWLKFLILSVVCLIFLIIPIYSFFFNDEVPKWSGERDMSYLKMVKTTKKVADFTQKEFPDVLVLTRWPLNSVFEDSIFGYVKYHFDVADYHGCQYLDEVKRDCLLILPLIEIPAFEVDLDLNCIEEKGFDLIKEVEWIRIYHKQI